MTSETTENRNVSWQPVSIPDLKEKSSKISLLNITLAVVLPHVFFAVLMHISWMYKYRVIFIMDDY